MESALRRDFLRRTYNALGLLVSSVEKLPSHYLDTKLLQDLDISLSFLDIESGDPIDFEPRFFQLKPAADLETGLKKRADDRIDEYEPVWSTAEPYYDNCPWVPNHHDKALDRLRYFVQFLSWCRWDLDPELDWVVCGFDETYEHLGQYHYRPYTEHWKTERLLLDERSDLPAKLQQPGYQPIVHASCLLSEGNEIDDARLLRSELLAAATLMRDQMRQRRHWGHYQFPVCIYTFSGYDVRVLQVYYDHLRSVLVVRATPCMRIDGESEEGLKNRMLVLRCLMSKPVGQTTFESLEPKDEEAADVKEGPRTPSKRTLRCGR